MISLNSLKARQTYFCPKDVDSEASCTATVVAVVEFRLGRAGEARFESSLLCEQLGDLGQSSNLRQRCYRP